MDRDALLNQLTVLDFMAVDLQLYLNTHPHDMEALEKYNSVIQNADKARMLYEKKYGPLCSFRSMGQPGWPWIDEPWPWAEDFNYRLGMKY